MIHLENLSALQRLAALRKTNWGGPYAAKVNAWLMTLAILFALPRSAVILQQMHVARSFVQAAVYRHLLPYANHLKISSV